MLSWSHGLSDSLQGQGPSLAQRGPVAKSQDFEGCLHLSPVAFVQARVAMRQLVKSAEVRIRHRKEQEKKAELDKIQAGLTCCLKHSFADVLHAVFMSMAY